MSDVLQFPPRDKGRIRKRRSPAAMGRCSVGMLKRDGEPIPAKVADIRSARIAPVIDDGRLALRLSLAIFAMLDPSQKKAIRNVLMAFANHRDDRTGDECRALYPFLTGEKLPC